MNKQLDEKNNPQYFERLLKPREVAILLNISRSFVYYLLKSGDIPVVRMGKACRVRPEDLAQYIERNLSGSNVIR